MKLTITAKIKIYPTSDNMILLKETMSVYRKSCNYISSIVFETKVLNQCILHGKTYRSLRNDYGLKSQMAQSVMKTVIARYKSTKSNGHNWNLVKFKKPEVDLVWNRDYSIIGQVLSVNTLQGRLKIPYETKGMTQYFDGSWTFGTAKLVMKHDKYFLHIPVTKDIPEIHDDKLTQVIGVDFGMNFLAVAYDSAGKTYFDPGRKIKDKRAHFTRVRKSLQRVKTPSSRRRLKSLGSRENRWMTDVNHQVSKALVLRYGKDALFVIEDLTGIRKATECVIVKDRYYRVSWAFYQLRQMLEYKARKAGSKVMAVDPSYTSQTCPKCAHIDKANRDKKRHHFSCKSCGYQSNDDRIGAMNLQQIGMKYIAEVTMSV